jgi:hypothetical protein
MANPNITIGVINENTLATQTQVGKILFTETGKNFIVKSNGDKLQITDVISVSTLPTTGITNKLYVLTSDYSLNIYDTSWHKISGGTGGSNQIVIGTTTTPTDTSKLFLDTTDNSKPILKYHNGTAWVNISGSSVVAIDDTNVSETTVFSSSKSEATYVKKETGKSLIADAEITRLSTVTNYDHTNVDSHMADTNIHTTLTEKNNYADKYTKNETDNKISAVVTSLDYKEHVSTFASIATTYPTPEKGWTVSVDADNITYKYDGTAWIPISANAVPMATSTLDGKISSTDYTKIQGISTGANKVEASTTNGNIKIDGVETTVANLSNKIEATNIKAGDNITLSINGNDVTINATGNSNSGFLNVKNLGMTIANGGNKATISFTNPASDSIDKIYLYVSYLEDLSNQSYNYCSTNATLLSNIFTTTSGASNTYDLTIDDVYRNKRVAFPEFSYDLHVVKPFEIPAHWRKWRSADNGYTDPFAWYWYTVDEFGTVYVYREYTRDPKEPKVSYSDQARQVALKSGNEHIGFTVVGHDAWAVNPLTKNQNTPQGKSIIDFYVEGGVKDCIRAVTDRVFRKATIHEYLKPYFDENAEKMTSRVKIFSTCEKLIETLPQMLIDDRDPEKYQENDIDHWVDSFGYGIISHHSNKSMLEERRVNYDDLPDDIVEDLERADAKMREYILSKIGR